MAARATRSAACTISDPEEPKRTRSAQGTRAQKRRASSISPRCCPAKSCPWASVAATAAVTAGGACPRMQGPIPST